MGKIYCGLLICLCLCLVMFVAAARGNSSSTIMCKDTEREVLLQIKKIFVTNNHFNVDVDSWVGEECCEWHGVVCDNVTTNIIAFKPTPNNVYHMNMEEVDAQFFESIVLALLRLKHLTYLKLTEILVSYRSIPFPKLIVSMKNLKYLNFSGNNLYGEIPPQLGNLTNLKVLDLSHNYLDGELPPQLGNLTKLKVLHLSYNGFGGKVPPQLGNLTKLKVLDLSHNYFLEGKVPPQLGNLTKLKVLDLSLNLMIEVENLRWVSCLSNLQYIGFSRLNLSSAFHTLIHAIDQLSSLTTLILSSSDLHNTQLSHLFFNNSAVLSTLRYLDLSDNYLESPLTPNIGNLSSLSYLDLSANSFNGSIPYSLRNISLLQVLNLQDNAFSHVEGGIWGIMKNPCHFQNLDLSSNNLQDDIQLLLEPVGNASKCTRYDLKYLNLNQNQISGSVPDSLRLLTEVEVLDFSYNSIQGNITNLHLDNLSKLSFFDVRYNNLSLDLKSDWLPPFQLEYFTTTPCKINHFPQWLQMQTKIQYLDLSNSTISGELHEWFYNTSTLYYLDLSNNFLNGPLPKQFKSEHLNYLHLGNNNLSGTIPGWLSYLGELTLVDLSSNNLVGSIPKTLGHNRCTISLLVLSGNKLEGSIPSNLGKCTNLELLDLYKNRLSGKIPYWIGEKLRNLSILRLQENQFGEFLSGHQTRATIPKSLCKLEGLQVLDFQKNQLSGSIPNCWKDSAQLQIINFSSNNLSGGIPCSLGNLLELEYLHLSNNKLNGVIPLCLSNLIKLRILNMGKNMLSGSIPNWIDPGFSRLQVLRLSKNKLNSTIPQNLCNFSSLHILDLSHNQLVGSVPTCLGSLTGINLPINSSNVNYNIDFPSYSYHVLSDENKITETIAGIEREYINIDLNYLATIDLSSNGLVGVVPEELTSLYGLIALNLADNHLTGNIPENIGDMKALETLDLSGNKLCGRIPTSLGNIDSLNHVNFSSNNLSGPIPSSRHFQTFDDPSIYAGNPYLCGDPMPKKCYIHDEQPITPEYQAEDDAEDKREKLWFYLVVMSGVATGFWGVIGILLVKKRWRYALFLRVEDAFDWLYVGVIFKVSKLKKMIKRDGNAD
ncbi:unnamed protein product [Amaranthus hypochondriacus]